MLRAALLSFATLLLVCSCHTGERPNIVLIIGDDHGWPDYGFMGSEVAHTPRLDQLASESTAFTHGFNTASVCRPSLRTLLTGLHNFQIEAHVKALEEAGEEVDGDRLMERFDTLPRRLAERGYAAFQGGKYWEGSFDTAGFTEGMAREMNAQEIEALGFEPTRIDRAAGGASNALGRTTMQPLWDFIDAHSEEPFFVWFAPKLPHSPHDPSPEDMAPYADVDLPDGVDGYFGNVTRFDSRMGELLDHLDEKGLRENTIVVYVSDNGWDAKGPIETTALGGERGKLTEYELGFRTPVLVRWPDRVPAGQRSETPISTVDVVATLLEMAGADPLPGRPGVSLLPLLGGEGEYSRDAVFASIEFERNPNWNPRVPVRLIPKGADVAFIRTPRWRYVWDSDRKRGRLADIVNDPREKENLAGVERSTALALREDLLVWRERMLRPWSVEDPPGT